MGPVLDTYVTVDDMVAFQRFCLENIEQGRAALRKLRLAYLTLPGVLAAIALVEFLAGDSGVAASLIALVVGVGGYAYVWVRAPRIALSSVRRQLMTLYPSGSWPPTRLWPDERGLHEQSAESWTCYPWTAVGRVDETPEHWLIWVSNLKALVIPKRSGEQQTLDFVSAVKEWVTWSRGPLGRVL